LKRYKHLFFDLDHTLWDFRTNSRAVLCVLYSEMGLAERGVPNPDELIATYEEINEGLWERYEKGHIPKEVMRVLRFRNTLLAFGVKDERLAERMGDAYLERTPLMEGLFPGALELLSDLRPAYGLHIITNGFETTQSTKLKSSGMLHLFDNVICSESVGASKPDARIFQKAMKLARTHVNESLMIGDNARADMAGARNVGMDHAHFAPEGNADQLATYRLLRLDELRLLLL
jgi:putative hydrolase of the HAD superfamily